MVFLFDPNRARARARARGLDLTFWLVKAAARWLDDHRKWELDKVRCSLGNRRVANSGEICRGVELDGNNTDPRKFLDASVPSISGPRFD